MNRVRKPDLVLPSGSVSITECAENLFAVIAANRDIFMRGGAMQELSRDDNGTLSLSVIRPDAFRSRVENYVNVKRWHAVKDEFALKDAICPDETAKALMASQPCERILPRIRGIASCPVCARISHSGASGQTEARVLPMGYHEAAGGVLVTQGETVPSMPVVEAVAFLKGMLDEFSFNSDSDRSRATAMMITPALRIGGWLRGHCPVFVIEADQSQTGKGYLLNLLCELYAERPSLIGQKDGGVGSLDESISAALLAGRPFIQFDNMRGRIASAFLEMVVTAGGLVPCRVPHRGEVSVDSSYFTFTLTSNGVETTQDLANRSCIIRIRKRTGHKFREYPDGDLREHIKANQTTYLGAVFSVIQAWAAAGCAKNRDENRHDFREWAQSLDFIVRNIMGEAPLLNGHDGAKTSVSNPALVWLRAVALAVENEGHLGREFSAAELAEICGENGIEIPGAFRPENDDERRKRVGILMAKLIEKSTSALEFDLYTVTRSVKLEYDHERQQNREKKVYAFARAVTNCPHLPHPPHQPNILSEKSGFFQEVVPLSVVGVEDCITLYNKNLEQTQK